MNEKRFSLYIIDGDWTQWIEDLLGVQSLKYENVSWNEATELARLSFKEGYKLVIWQMDDGEEVGGTDNGATESS